jgi:hypothetical protein
MANKEEIDNRVAFSQLTLIDKLFMKLDFAIGGLWKSFWKGVTGTETVAAKNSWNAKVQVWIDKGFIDKDTGDLLKRLREEEEPVGWISSLITHLNMFKMLIDSSMQVAGLDRQYDLMQKTTPHPAPVDYLVRSMIIDPTRATENRTQLKRHGFSDTQIDNIILSHYTVVNEDVIRTNFLRGNISEPLMYERMRELGYTDTRIKEIIQTWIIYPGPQDLFTMVAHEAFEPDQYIPLGLADEFPSEQTAWLEAQGISKEWAMKYWIAHWQQPSLEQGFEMLHRGIITRAELDMLFKVVEIPKFWRDKLMQMTYNPYTRVDVRRMHDLGVLTTPELVTAYQDLGYDADKAVKMAEFTIRLNNSGNKELTRSIILSSYKDDLISREDALKLLKEQDYSDDVAEYYLIYTEYQRDTEIQKMYIDVIEEKYYMNLINENEAKSSLNGLGLRGTKTEALIEKWNVHKYKYEQIPSRTDMDDMLIQGVIDENQWRALMTRHGYGFTYQGWYLQLIDKYLISGSILPTKAELKAWLLAKIINKAEYRVEMSKLGYSEVYISNYLKSFKYETID